MEYSENSRNLGYILQRESYIKNFLYMLHTHKHTQTYQISPVNLSNMIDNEGKKLNGAPFTIKSKKTGKDYTFRISQVPFKNNNYIHIKVETEYLNFRYMGYFRDGNIVRKNKEKNVTETVTTPAAEAAAWLLRQLKEQKFGNLSASVEIFHLGKCLKCGKTLTDSESIQLGFGPVCRNK